MSGLVYNEKQTHTRIITMKIQEDKRQRRPIGYFSCKGDAAASMKEILAACNLAGMRMKEDHVS